MNIPCDLPCREDTRREIATEPTPDRARRVPASAASIAPSNERVGAPGIAQIVELILKDRWRLDQVAHATGQKVELASRLLAIAVAAFTLYGLAMSLTFYAARMWPQPVSPADWLNDSETRFVTFIAGGVKSDAAFRAVRLTLAYSFGLIAATGICLPSLYFYGLLSGLRMTMTDVVVHSLKCTAVAAVALIGILPVYSALALGAIVLPGAGRLIELTLILGLCLPFIGGFWGTRALFVGFVNLCDTMPPEFQKQRACFLRRLILSWCGCYLAVAPLMINTVWRHLGS